MQDEVNEKTVSLCIRCGKVTANLLKAAMKKALAKMEQEKQKLQGQKQPKQDKEDKTYKGKQSMDKLMKQNVQLSNIEITDGNIKSFERVAKKYSIDFSLKKDVNADPPRYYVFFKARDADVMTAAYLLYRLLQTTCHSYLTLLRKLYLPEEVHLCRLAVNILLSEYLYLPC